MLCLSRRRELILQLLGSLEQYRYRVTEVEWKESTSDSTVVWGRLGLPSRRSHRRNWERVFTKVYYGRSQWIGHLITVVSHI